MTITDSTAEALVVVSHVSKRFVLHKDKSLKDRLLYWRNRARSRDEFLALDDVDVEIRLGETVGLIGHNGSGKSTLLKVIGGIIEASSGEVYRRGRVAALLELGAGFHPDLTGRDNVYLNAAILGMSTSETDAVFDDIVEFSGIGDFIDSQVKFYSSGMYVRLAFAVAVHSDPDLLLVDEVLAVGDEPFQLKCMNKIRQFQKEGRTIVLVSHSAEQVADVCTRAVVLDAGRVVHDGDVGAGIRTLREGYERDRVAAEEREQAAAGADTAPPIVVNSVSIEHADGQAFDGAPIRRGTDVAITIHVDVVRPVEWITGFTLSSTIGNAVYRLNSEGLGMILPTSPGRYAVRFELPDTNFGINRLVVSAGATTVDGEPIALLDPAGHLDFEDDPYGAGLVQFEARGTVSIDRA
ncbi:ATP-binding cassette domain-containing protein [Agromyces sp. CFH 90414]|uniref:ATP-binding cassette domain-containing protein n=1 Tax=Agromyces agglutinans TaxID=2662258 RepID=A0A6I2F897_9MICO|nr:ABC transporter ATP-binding protein [Agromyces agglutinans]MRG60551.1 ATP-binding cassette domain-containing protein [Agromyces agglutinans]